MSTLRHALLAALAVLAAGPASGQSLLSARGLGLPLIATDARALALGGVGSGLQGGELSVADPAAPARLRIPSVAFAFQSSWAQGDAESGSGDFSGTRFPFIALGYPTALGTVSVTFGGVLDQRWSVTSRETIELDDGEGLVSDEFVSDGGVSSVRLGLARTLPGGIDVGVQIGRNIGDVSRVFTRRFDSLDVGSPVPEFRVGGRWSYRGWTASAGVAADVGSVLRLAGSWTWSSDLDALPDEDTAGGDDSFAMPTEIRAGATAILSPRLRAVLGVHRASWSAADADISGEGGARDTFSWGGGLELGGLSVLGKTSALRLGYRDAQLPFTTPEATEPGESAFAMGLGMNLLTSGEAVLARLDFALERGLREAGSFEERFWRLSTSVRVSGF